jgi:methylenetetrahydrofolate reductase (NADPH)
MLVTTIDSDRHAEDAPARRLTASFELFPPKNDDGIEKFDATVDELTALGPAYFSVTYGAGGSTRDRTRACVDRVMRRTGLPVHHHLTCVGASRAEIEAMARELWDAGIRSIVALRGDPPDGSSYAPQPDGYAFAPDLVEGLRRVADFDISVGAYPEVHPQAESAESDIENLKRKLDAGAARAITQYAFDTDTVLRFIERARAAGITAPIIPGIMPVANFKGLVRFSERCGASIPDWMVRMFDGLDDDIPTRSMVSTAVTVEQCRRLAEAGIEEFHFYTLNRADVSRAVCRVLSVTPAAVAKSGVRSV